MTDAAYTISTVFSTNTRLGVTGSAGRIVPGIVAKVVKHDGTLEVFNEPRLRRAPGPGENATGYVDSDDA